MHGPVRYHRPRVKNRDPKTYGGRGYSIYDKSKVDGHAALLCTAWLSDKPIASRAGCPSSRHACLDRADSISQMQLGTRSHWPADHNGGHAALARQVIQPSCKRRHACHNKIVRLHGIIGLPDPSKCPSSNAGQSRARFPSNRHACLGSADSNTSISQMQLGTRSHWPVDHNGGYAALARQAMQPSGKRRHASHNKIVRLCGIVGISDCKMPKQ